jgi:hypothetical protein
VKDLKGRDSSALPQNDKVGRHSDPEVSGEESQGQYEEIIS